MPDPQTIEQIARAIRDSIARAQSTTSAHAASERAFQRVLALLWSAHDELEALTRPRAASAR